jgi:hypothetical protein
LRKKLAEGYCEKGTDERSQLNTGDNIPDITSDSAFDELAYADHRLYRWGQTISQTLHSYKVSYSEKNI